MTVGELINKLQEFKSDARLDVDVTDVVYDNRLHPTDFKENGHITVFRNEYDRCKIITMYIR